MLTDRGEIKVVDFGLAKMPDKNMTESGTLMGTAAYMSPEQVRGEKVNDRTDIWSLGVVLFEMLKGEPPFRGESGIAVIRAIEGENPPALEGAPQELASIVHRAMQKDPKSRYGSMNELLGELKAAKFALGFSDSGSASELRPLGRELRRPRYTVAAVALLATLAALGYGSYERSARVRWARQEALPEIERLADAMSGVGGSHYAWPAFELASEAERAIPGDAVLERLWLRITRDVTIDSEPSGAQVFVKPYSEPEREWLDLGPTPVEGFAVPLGFTRVKLEKEGYRAVHDLVLIRGGVSRSATWNFDLQGEEDVPEEMVRFAGETRPLRIPGVDHLDAEPLESFLMDRYEVTNDEFKDFVDAGAYEKKEFWRELFVRDGRALSWEEAMSFFKDKTGRSGPATWEVGDYPEGHDEFPVSGVSWYEAAAYAAFAEKSLPTIFHWNLAAWTPAAAEVVPMSNFSGEGTVPVGSQHGMNRMGTFDVAGNVREWCFNATRRGQRFILGGGWNDPAYAFTDSYAQSEWDRSPTNGFRCIRHFETEDRIANLTRDIELPFRDYFTET